MSTSLKRKVDELDDSDDEEPMLGRQVLPIANLPDNYDGVPMDGMQYLFTVRRDARLLPHTTRVVNPYEVPEVPSTTASSGGDETQSSRVRKDVLPSDEWRNTFLRRFKNFRKNSVQPTIHVHTHDSSAKLMPDKKERDLWWAFLAGRPESEWNPPKKPKQPKVSRWQQRNLNKGINVGDVMPGYLEDDALPYDISESSDVSPHSSGVPPSSSSTPSIAPSIVHPHVEAAISSISIHPPPTEVFSSGTSLTGDGRGMFTACIPREPTPMLFQRMDHRYAIHLLMYFAHWVNLRLEDGHLPYTDITQTHAQWIFSLLSRVDDWLPGDEISILRTLARGCVGLMVERRKHSVEKKVTEDGSLIDERSCWMIITAITGIWGQPDLWTDAESELSMVERAIV